MGRRTEDKPRFPGEFPKEMMPGQPFFTLIPGKEAVVAGCKGLICLEEEEITLSLGSWILSVQGSNLVLSGLESGLCRISGRVLGASLKPGKRKGGGR